jgi:hypothetical protein
VVAGRPGLRPDGLIIAGCAVLLAVMLVVMTAPSPVPAADLPESDDFYSLWGRVKVGAAAGQWVEPDLRQVPWHTLRRLALVGGEFTAPYRPVSAGEITDTIMRIRESGGPTLALAAQRRQMAWLLYRYGLAGAPWRWDSCVCREPRVYVAAGGRVEVLELGPGGVVAGEAGLTGRGLHAVIEPDVAAWSGRYWAGATLRLHGPLATAGRGVDDALLYGAWPAPTGRPAEGAARLADPDWRLDAPRLVAGAAPGGWSLTAGVFPAAVGPGLDGQGLTLTANADPVPQLVVRRTRPFTWSGFLGGLDPDHLLFRAGILSPRDIRYRTEWGLEERHGSPGFFQWLVTWNHTSWWRTTLTHAAVAASREGESLWGDLLQVNFPLLDATWNEVEYGPVTDRVFTLTMEARFREAPWPLLPRAAGRVYWEYGGEDFRPHDSLPVLPEISAPASLVGVELVDHRWDLGVEYLETRHPLVLWYGNSGFPAGYTEDGIVLGHDLGGAVQAWTALVRWRTESGAHEWELRGRTAAWAMDGRLPGEARRRELDLAWRGLAGSSAWTLGAGLVAEEVGGADDHWIRGRLSYRF